MVIMGVVKIKKTMAMICFERYSSSIFNSSISFFIDWFKVYMVTFCKTNFCSSTETW